MRLHGAPQARLVVERAGNGVALPATVVREDDACSLGLDRGLAEVDDLTGFEVLHHTLLSVGRDSNCRNHEPDSNRIMFPIYNGIIISNGWLGATGPWKHSLASATMPLAPRLDIRIDTRSRGIKFPIKMYGNQMPQGKFLIIKDYSSAKDRIFLAALH